MTVNCRNYIRHPTDVPIQVRSESTRYDDRAVDISEGGVCFLSTQAMISGQLVAITISLCRPPFTADGTVRWCKQQENCFLVGVSFQDQEVAYALRMVEQVCYIEQYRQQVRDEKGIELTSQQAALEWVTNNAAQFKKSFF